MPTALELTQQELRRYRPRPAAVRLTAAQRAQRAELLGRAREVARLLRERYAVKRVFLFGSLAHEAWFSEDSDVDLAVEGLPRDAFWSAWRLAEELITDRPVDLVTLEDASASLKSSVELRGILL
jgi:uncharacterized protein